MKAEQRVLIVDDEEVARETLKKVVERAGYACVAVESGEEALGVLRSWPAHVVVADHDMAGMTGVELLGAVSVRHPEMCRILLSGRTDGDTALSAINVAHVYCYLTKPCRSSELLTVLHFACETFEAERESRRLLSVVSKQEALLKELERRCPDVVQMARSALAVS